jgi:hypothetical protein
VPIDIVSFSNPVGVDVAAPVVLIPNHFTTSNGSPFIACTQVQAFVHLELIWFCISIIEVASSELDNATVLVGPVALHTEASSTITKGCLHFFRALTRAIIGDVTRMPINAVSIIDGGGMDVAAPVRLIPNHFTTSDWISIVACAHV